MKKVIALSIALTLSLFASVGNAQVTVTQSTTAPTPGPNDISLILPATDDGLNYYDNNSTPPGQTFTTLSNAGGYTLTNLTIKTAGNGGGGETSSQTYTLSIYSVFGSSATLITTYTASLALVQDDWVQWSGLNVTLLPNTQYAYTLSDGTSAYEELADQFGTPYSGGQICLIPAGGGTITYGQSGTFSATFDAGLALGSAAAGTPTLTQSATDPVPGANDIYQLNTSPIPGQNNYGLNYYDNAGSGLTPPGQTFKTLASPVGFVMTNLSIEDAGSGGNTELGTLTYTLTIYSVAGSTATLISSNSIVFALATASKDWITFSGLNVPLSAKTNYAFALSDNTGHAYEEMANYSGDQYTNGQICLIPISGGTITYGNGGANYSDAAFDVGLAIPQIPVVQTPTYAPNVTPAYAGTAVTLSESASGPSPLYYQWQTDGGSGGSLTNIASAISTNLTVNTTGFIPGTYNYDVIVSNIFGVTTSSVEPLTIVAASAPIIVTNTAFPNSSSNFVGLSQTYNVAVAGTLPIAYQWQVSPNANGSGAVNISGATNTTLVLNNLQLANTGYYSLLATNVISPFTANSPWTLLSVVPATNEFITWSAPVTFNGFTAGQILTNPPGTLLEAAYFGPNAGPITVTVNGNPYIFYGDGSTASVAGDIGQTTGAWPGAGTNTTGDTNLDDVLNGFAYDSTNAPQSGTHTITIKNLVVGQQYAVQLLAIDDRAIGIGRVNNFQDPNDNADFSATYDPSYNDYLIGTFTAPSTSVAIQQNLPTGYGNINAVVVRALSYVPAGTAPFFATQPSSVSAYVGRTVQFSAIAIGAPVPTYQWQISTDGGNTFSNLVTGSDISGTTNTTLTISNVSVASPPLEFELTATNSAGGTNSVAAILTVLTAPPLSGPYSTNVLALHPVAYWPLNETVDPYNNGAGGTAVYDASGNEYDGVYLYNAFNGFDGIVGPQPADGYPQFAIGQGAYSPQGAYPNSWANLPALNLNTNTVTIVMWLNPKGVQNATTGLLVNRNAGTIAGMTYSGNALGYVWNNNDPGTYGYTGGPVIPTNIWSMVALVVTPTNTSFYVINTNNGVVSTTYAYNNNIISWGGSLTNIYLGADSQTTRIFNGTLDEPAVFNYALTTSQLANLAGVAVPINTNAATANFQFVVTGGTGNKTLNFSWAPDHLGWELYTNSVGLTATGSWHPVPGSASVTSESITINSSKTNVFFQLRYP